MKKRKDLLSKWTWEDWAVVEHALEELLHIGQWYDCFDIEYLKHASRLLRDVQQKKED